jgi:alpha-glucuronidase
MSRESNRSSGPDASGQEASGPEAGGQGSSSQESVLGKISRRALLSFGVMSPFFLSPIGLFATSAGALTANESKVGAEDGYRAWLRYHESEDAPMRQSYRRLISNVVVVGDSATAKIVQDELTNGLSALLGEKISVSREIIAGSIVVATSRSPLIAKLIPEAELLNLGPDGFLIRSTLSSDSKVIVIVSESDAGTLYGAFALLRLMQTHHPLEQLSIREKPKNPLRILAHWDNPDGTIERGYAGKSLWKWNDLPQHVDQRLLDYARINASIGINGVVLNNVNSDPTIFDASNLRKVAVLANIFRPYGLKVYFCANWAAPCKLDHLPTADPLNDQVIDWWRKKANEIYGIIPDFGGFLVKANSEGIPGPQDYGRTHADGANCLANALAPHGGIVMWRAFVYTVGNQDSDRVKRAYLEFKPLDGKFADNVLVQIKNGPLDFQPREPFHPLFGAMPKSRVMAELQITQEYLGQSTHLVYLATSWKEVLESDTYGNGANSSVAEIIESVPKPGSGGMSAGANTGSDRNWCGHHFAQANWFAYGRLAWNSDLTAAEIAEEWIKMTWSNSTPAVECIRDMMLKSYEAYVDYTMPLGLHHMVGGDHYAPLPEGEGDPRGIFHHASADGIGYDRTRAGSDAVDQYHPPLNDRFNDPATCPEKYLLWFHHLPWDHRMASGRTLWQELCFKYESGIKTACEMEKQWRSIESAIDGRRYQEVAVKLRQQVTDSEKWADKCLTYFSQYSKLPRV